MSDIKNIEQLKYDSSVTSDKHGKAILGVLEGPCADFVNATRNGRLYSQELWEKVFDNPLIKEQFECGGILGELDHPEGRDEIDTSKVAICMPEAPHKNSKGQLVARFDILDTPNGRIAKTLCDYGYKFGISSRGTGDVTEDLAGNEVVDPDTYDFKCFDLVLLPSVKAARMKVVESLNTKKSLKQALTEALDNADEDARKVMKDTLNHLNIDVESSEDNEAVDDAKAEIVKELQDSIKARQTLETENRLLQEKLSVCYAKETQTQEELQRYKSAVASLSDSAKRVKPLQSKVGTLEEALSAKENVINNQQVRIQKLLEKLKNSDIEHAAVTEKLNAKSASIEQRLNESYAQHKSLTEKVNLIEQEKSQLKESLETLRKDTALKAAEYKSSLEKVSKLVEHYKQVANNVSDYYIRSKASALGISAQEIKNRLAESYTFEDVNRVCDDIRNYQLNVSRLPFDLKRSTIKVTESKETLAPLKQNIDDEVDDQLLGLQNSLIKK